MTQADAIRQFVNSTYIEPARLAGTKQVLVRAGTIHTAMGLKDRMPAVAGALGGALAHAFRWPQPYWVAAIPTIWVALSVVTAWYVRSH